MRSILKHAILVFFATLFAVPVMWMFLLSIKSSPESHSTFADLFSAPSTLSNYSDAWTADSFDKYFSNSLLVNSAITVANVLLSFVVGSSLGRRNSPLNKVSFALVILVLAVPHQVIMISLYRMISSFHWVNTYLALIIPFLISPLGIFLIRQYVSQLPKELEDSARIDGMGETAIRFRILFPLSLPAITVLAIITFLSNWNSYLLPFLFTNDEAHRTLPVGLAFYLGKQSIDWGHMMAGSAMSAIPILVLFVVFQKQIIRGMTSGALKE